MKVNGQFHSLVASTPRKDLLVFTGYEPSRDGARLDAVQNSKLTALLLYDHLRTGQMGPENMFIGATDLLLHFTSDPELGEPAH
jgi:hypothetical protein